MNKEAFRHYPYVPFVVSIIMYISRGFWENKGNMTSEVMREILLASSMRS